MKTIRTEDIPADAKARDFLSSLDLSHGEVVLEQNGQPRMVLVSANLLEQRQRAKQRLFALIDQIHEQHPGLSSDDLLDELQDLDRPGQSSP